MWHSVFTVVAVIKPCRLGALEDLLAQVQADPAANELVPFGQIPNLHFASFVVFRTPPQLEGLREFEDPILVFESNIDGCSGTSRREYLEQLFAAGPGLDGIYEKCVGYPGEKAELAEKVGYLLGRVRKPQLFHVGTPYRSVRGIKRDRALREKLDLRLRTVMGKSLPAQLDTPAAGTGERGIWERLRQRISWAVRGLASGLLVRALWRHTASFAQIAARLHWLSPILAPVRWLLGGLSWILGLVYWILLWLWLSPILAPVRRLLHWLSGILVPVHRILLWLSPILDRAHHWLSVLYPHWPSLLVLLLFVKSLAFSALADSQITDPEQLRTRQWLPLTIAAFLLAIVVQMLWAAQRPLAWVLLLTFLPAAIWLLTLVDIRHNRLERLDELGSAGDVPSPASVVRQLHRLAEIAGDRARLCRLRKQRLTYAGVGLITGLVAGFAYPYWPSLLLLLLFVVCVGLLAMVGVGEDDPDRLRPLQWTPWAIGALVVGMAARPLWDASGWHGLLLLSFFIGLAAWAATCRSGCPRPRIWKLWNWRWWALVWLGIFALMWGFERLMRSLESVWAAAGRRVWLAAFVALFFFLKALWLSALAGWRPFEPLTPRWPPKVILFVTTVPLIGFVFGGLLIVLGWSLPWIALAVLGSMLLLWSVPLPSPPVPKPRRNPLLPELRDQEDRDVQNHMAAMVVLEAGWPRKPLLTLFLRTLNVLFFRALLPDVFRGKLFGLPTVHFAQWIVLDSRRYLFLSNYDHSWTRYLDDFGLQLTTGIQKIWGLGQDNPGTSNLDSFKEYARSTMVPHKVWYRAYPGLTLDQIWNNQMIRRGLGRTDGNDESAIALLRRFAAGPRIQNAFSK